MAKDLDKYKSEVLKLSGFALTIPLGKIYLDLPQLFISGVTHWFIAFYILISFLLWLAGIIIILRGMIHLGDK